mmetsp:Transcript_26240/g.75693  ORF Transcript_26240/g.75693 Transcript_26240/m.75693 type:complete len:467 (+) Transcript_26240:259-1659(+)
MLSSCASLLRTCVCKLVTTSPTLAAMSPLHASNFRAVSSSTCLNLSSKVHLTVSTLFAKVSFVFPHSCSSASSCWPVLVTCCRKPPIRSSTFVWHSCRTVSNSASVLITCVCRLVTRPPTLAAMSALHASNFRVVSSSTCFNLISTVPLTISTLLAIVSFVLPHSCSSASSCWPVIATCRRKTPIRSSTFVVTPFSTSPMWRAMFACITFKLPEKVFLASSRPRATFASQSPRTASILLSAVSTRFRKPSISAPTFWMSCRLRALKPAAASSFTAPNLLSKVFRNSSKLCATAAFVSQASLRVVSCASVVTENSYSLLYCASALLWQAFLAASICFLVSALQLVISVSHAATRCCKMSESLCVEVLNSRRFASIQSNLFWIRRSTRRPSSATLSPTSAHSFMQASTLPDKAFIIFAEASLVSYFDSKVSSFLAVKDDNSSSPLCLMTASCAFLSISRLMLPMPSFV